MEGVNVGWSWSILNSYQLHVTCKFGFITRIRISWVFFFMPFAFIMLLIFVLKKERWIACMVKDAILMTSIGEKMEKCAWKWKFRI